ncbi:LTA synthase family protein [Rurimicrobium arvi]
MKQKLSRVAVQITVLLLAFAFSRIMLLILNADHFNGVTPSVLLRILFYGLRFDLSAIAALNSLYWLLFLFPAPRWPSAKADKVLQYWFIIINATAFLFEIADWAYFPYNHKRSTAELLQMLSRKGDFVNLLPAFLKGYWYLFLAGILFIVLLAYLNNSICKRFPLKQEKQSHIKSILTYCLSLTLAFIALRGGVQLVPLGIKNAAGITQPNHLPLVLNTPFSIINTLGARALEPVHYMSDAAAEKLIGTRKQFTGKEFRPKNVVVIVLESFSKEFTAIGGLQSYTPFFDSLMQHSLVCTQSFANGYHSAEGIPAIFAGIPSLQEEPFTTSVYGTNRITSLPGTLKSMGYSSAFYHGGTNGTMSFDVFCRNAQFDRYAGRNEYNNEGDFDGDWGIWDEPFLQFAVKDISGRLHEPFFAGIFTLSSHHPYRIPPQYKGKFPSGKLEIYESIGYTDFSLRRFFQSASRESWFQNTLFVLVADHCSALSANEYYNMHQGRFAVPLVFFAPGDTSLRGSVDKLTQQIDILPSVLDYLGYPRPFFAFGNSIFRKDVPAFTVQHIDGHLCWTMDRFFIRITNGNMSAVFDRFKDPLDNGNMLPEISPDTFTALRYQRAFWQVYTDKMIHNNLFIEQ